MIHSRTEDAAGVFIRSPLHHRYLAVVLCQGAVDLPIFNARAVRTNSMCTGKFSLLEMHIFQHTVNPTCRVETRSETGFGWSVALEDLDRQTGSRAYALSTRVPPRVVLFSQVSRLQLHQGLTQCTTLGLLRISMKASYTNCPKKLQLYPGTTNYSREY